MKKILKYIFIFIILIIIFVLSLTLIAYIPNEIIKENTMESAKQLDEIGEKKYYNILGKKITNFYFTDVLMINEAYSMNSDKGLESAILTRKNYNSNITKKISMIDNDVLAAKKFENTHKGTCKELIEFINGNVDESFEYPRYWHGYLIFLKPLLILFNYTQIVYLLLTITIGLIIVLNLLIYKKFQNIYLNIFFLISIIIFDMEISIFTINENICFIISIIGSILILKREKTNMLFFIIGILTSFFDLLTLPIITLCYMLVFSCMKEQNPDNLKENIRSILVKSILWGVGYAGCWAAKWIITDAIYQKGIIQNAFSQILYRTTGQKICFSYLVENLINNIGLIPIVILSCINIIYFININKKNCHYLVIALIPLLWVIILKNHSTIHSFFAYKNFQITAFSLLVAISDKYLKQRQKTN